MEQCKHETYTLLSKGAEHGFYNYYEAEQRRCHDCLVEFYWINGLEGIGTTPNPEWAFVLHSDRTFTTPPQHPRDSVDEYAEAHGISRLHAIHELDGA
jgi:hypothetical protein